MGFGPRSTESVLREIEPVFGNRHLRITTLLTSSMPPQDHVSAAHCLGFDEKGAFLLTKHVDRQWTIPGGHREPHETPEEAMRREVMEEAAAVVADPVLLAIDRIQLMRGPVDPRYPVPSFQVFFVARVVELNPLVPNLECTESRLFSVDEARQLPGWMSDNQHLFDAALAIAGWP
jgi:8-oxo-dGTP pyrophosphatase MutT (NUDIX family)